MSEYNTTTTPDETPNSTTPTPTPTANINTYKVTETYNIIPGSKYTGKKGEFAAKIHKISANQNKCQSVRVTKNTNDKMMLRCVAWKTHKCPFKAGITYSKKKNCWSVLREPFFCLQHTCPENADSRQRNVRTDMILANSKEYPAVHAYVPDLSRDINGKKKKRRLDCVQEIIELGKEDGLVLKKGQARCIMLHKLKMSKGETDDDAKADDDVGDNHASQARSSNNCAQPDETDVQALVGLEICNEEALTGGAVAGASTERNGPTASTLLTSVLSETEKINEEAARIAAENDALKERLIAKEQLAKVISENRELRQRLERAESLISGDNR